jgi:hypothetical protein
MTERVKVKVHDVLHDKHNENATEIETYIENSLYWRDVVDVRVATGPKNSPLFVTLNTSWISVEEAMRVAQEMVESFFRKIGESKIDSDNVVQQENVRVISV